MYFRARWSSPVVMTLCFRQVLNIFLAVIGGMRAFKWADCLINLSFSMLAAASSPARSLRNFSSRRFSLASARFLRRSARSASNSALRSLGRIYCSLFCPEATMASCEYAAEDDIDRNIDIAPIKYDLFIVIKQPFVSSKKCGFGLIDIPCTMCYTLTVRGSMTYLV